MTLHDRESIRDQLLDSVFAGQDLSMSMPKYKFPPKESAAESAFQVVHDELMLDGNSRQNLATFCQTWEEPQVHELMDLCIDKNMIDKDEYPQTAEIENRCVHMLADLWHAPRSWETIGCSTTGSSEACMLGGLALKWQWRKRMQAAGRPNHPPKPVTRPGAGGRAAGPPTDRPNLITGPVQVCWHKFARYFDVELREIPLERGRLGMTAAEVLKRWDEKTIGAMP